MATLNGGNGNDNLPGDIENDIINGFAGNDSLSGGDGTDSILGGDGADSLFGDAGNDTLRGNAGNDYLNGGDGDDSLFGGGGFDSADYGGTSLGGINANLATGLVTGGAGNDTVAGIENIFGSNFDDTITGDGQDNFLSGNGGNDSILGGLGNDNLQGGSGNDTLLGGTGFGFDQLTGGAGNDLLDGGAMVDFYNGTDQNQVSYSGATSGVFVDMRAVTGDGSVGNGTALDGEGGTDTLLNFHSFILSSHNDTMLGSSGAYFEQFEGGLGDDVLNGGGFETVYLDGYNAVTYHNSPGAVLVDLQAGYATGASGNDIVQNMHRVRGSNSSDTLLGSDTTLYTEEFEGRNGNDTIDGRGGGDRVRYNYLGSNVGVYVNLATGVAIAGATDIDTLISIERVRGSQYNDTLIGGNPQFGADQYDGFEQFRGDAGNDFIDGGAGFDEVSFSSSGTGIYVVLGGTSTGYAFDGSGGIDTLMNIEQVYGSYYNDYMEGSDSADFESFDGQIGNDTIDGKGGTDRVSYFGSRAPANINLTTGIAVEYTAYGGETMATDTLRNIEWARGSENFGDTMIGNDAANRFEGNGGDDTMDGLAGNDTLEGGNGSDTYHVRDVGDVVTETNRLRVTGGDDIVLSYLTAAQAPGGYLLGDYVETLRIATTEAANGSGNSLDNLIVANIGNNVLDGGSGRDTISFELAATGVSASIASTATGPQATGGSGSDILLNFENITGGSGNDSLTGSAGDNEIRGGAGTDTMVGGLGNDQYEVDNVGDVIVETSALALEIEDVYSSVTYSLAGLANVENLHLEGGGFIHATGNALANFLEGGEGANSLIGADGNDTLDGGQGSDTLLGGNGDDVYGVNSADDVVSELPGQGNDLIRSKVSFSLVDTDGAGGNGGNVENLELTGNGTIDGTGNGLDNIIYAGSGNNVINGGAGVDTVSYARSQLAVQISLGLAGVAQNTTSSGQDTLISIEWLEGSAFNDTLTGDANNNKLVGLTGNDFFNVTSGGDDTILGGPGADSIMAGGPGNKLIDGGVSFDFLLGSDANYLYYSFSSVPVSINLSGITGDGSTGSGFVDKGAFGLDTLVNINQVAGSNFDDVLIGSNSTIWEWFEGLGGNDIIDGGTHTDLIFFDDSNAVSYSAASAAVNANLQTGLATGGGGNDSLTNIDWLVGSPYSDILNGSSFAFETFDGRGGDDTIDGASGFDRVRYTASSTGVTVNLSTGVALDGDGGTDTLSNIERVDGSRFADVLIGGNSANGVGSTDGLEAFSGRAGNDTIDGGAGYDRAEYVPSLEGVMVVLGGTGLGFAYDGQGGFDTLIGIEGVRGGRFADRLYGSDSGVFESFEGRDGNDTIDGKGGTDRVEFLQSRAGVVVNLLTGTASDGLGGNDTLLNIEDVRGSSFNDNLYGTLGNNKLVGELGNDTLTGDTGFDMLDGGDGNDLLSGGLNADTLIGGFGNDVLGGGQGVDSMDGGDGNDSMSGGLGSDTMTGGAGLDRFTFKNQVIGVTNVDTLVDFTPGTDLIELSASIFTAFSGQVGQTIGVNANLVYNNLSGTLAYDPDGAGLGGATTFAIVGSPSHPGSLGNAFLIVA